MASGIPLATLESLRQQWLNNFDWNKEQISLNRLNHYTTEIEGLEIHFVRQESAALKSIPLLLVHGWPGSFLEMEPLVDLLTEKDSDDKHSKDPVFDIVIPSLPGFGFSSPAPDGWTIVDTARAFNTLMHEVLGYSKYSVHGTDWGSAIAYTMYKEYTSTVRAAHFNFLPFYPLNFEQLAQENISLSPHQIQAEQRTVDWYSSGNGYFVQQATKPNTIGLALFDNPVGQLAWIGEKFISCASWSFMVLDTGHSVLNNNEILRHVSFYYLTQTFISSVYIYHQNPHGFVPEYSMAETDAPLLYSAFSHNVAFWPKDLVMRVGNLVSYKFHEDGGHFPALEVPALLAEDIREIAKYWSN